MRVEAQQRRQYTWGEQRKGVTRPSETAMQSSSGHARIALRQQRTI